MKTLRSSLLSAVAALTVYAATCQPAAAAATASTYTVQGNVYRVVEFAGSDANEIRLSTVVKGPAANNPYAARVVPIKQSRFAAWFKPKLGSLIKANLWWMGFAAIIESAGWAIDELKSEVVQQPRGYYYGYLYRAVNGSDVAYGSTPDEVCYNVGQFPYYKSIGWTVTVDASLGRCPVADDNGISKGYWPFTKYKCDNRTYVNSSVPPTIESCTLVNPEPVPVSDADFQAAVNAQLAADPEHAATAFTDPETGRGYAELFDPVPYIPGLSQTDEALVNCYLSGQLQMTNPRAACYVPTQLEYDRVKALVDALAAGRTPDSTADALNDDLQQPITQAQYEESNKKFSDAIDSVTSSLPNNESDTQSIDDAYNDLDGIITDLPSSTLPAPADISVPQYVDCQQLTLSDGNGHELVFPSPAQCAKIETFKQGFGYFLAISVVFLLGMQLLTRPHG